MWHVSRCRLVVVVRPNSPMGVCTVATIASTMASYDCPYVSIHTAVSFPLAAFDVMLTGISLGNVGDEPFLVARPTIVAAMMVS